MNYSRIIHIQLTTDNPNGYIYLAELAINLIKIEPK